MLDNLFKWMAVDSYANWESHLRLMTEAGPLSLSYPHHIADGGFLSSEMMPALMRWSGTLRQATEEIVGPRLVRVPNRTHFQVLLQHLLNSELTNCRSIAIAVGLSPKRIPELVDQRNRAAFPILEREELLSLVESEPTAWTSSLVRRAVREYHDYITVGKELRELAPKLRRRIYPRFPINQCDAVVTYLGDLTRALPELESSAITAIEMAGSTTRGPRGVWTCYSVKDRLRVVANPTNAEGFSWEKTQSQVYRL